MDGPSSCEPHCDATRRECRTRHSVSMRRSHRTRVGSEVFHPHRQATLIHRMTPLSTTPVDEHLGRPPRGRRASTRATRDRPPLTIPRTIRRRALHPTHVTSSRVPGWTTTAHRSHSAHDKHGNEGSFGSRWVQQRLAWIPLPGERGAVARQSLRTLQCIATVSHPVGR